MCLYYIERGGMLKVNCYDLNGLNTYIERYSSYVLKFLLRLTLPLGKYFLLPLCRSTSNTLLYIYLYVCFNSLLIQS